MDPAPRFGRGILFLLALDKLIIIKFGDCFIKIWLLDCTLDLPRLHLGHIFFLKNYAPEIFNGDGLNCEHTYVFRQIHDTLTRA